MSSAISSFMDRLDVLPETYDVMESKTTVAGLLSGRNCMILRSLVLSQYHRVTNIQTDEQTDRHAAYC